MRQNLLKIKPLTKEQIFISIDRLTRFKNPETKYLRVFRDLIMNNLISPKFKKTELDVMDYKQIKNHAEEIINFSLKQLFPYIENDGSINKILFDYETNLYKTDKNTEFLLQNNINYRACLELIDDNSPVNLKWLKNLSFSQNQTVDREKKSLLFPIDKVVISEGITEEILLPKFAQIYGYDFNKNGVYIISAGGKNQVVKLFYKLSEELKIPIFVLLDNDAEKNYNEIKPKLRIFDKVHVINCGEFEDALPLKLIKKALAYGLKNISMIELESVNQKMRMVKILEEIFKHRGLHEFKKSEFALMVKENISDIEDISPEICNIIEEIKQISIKTKVMVDN